MKTKGLVSFLFAVAFAAFPARIHRQSAGGAYMPQFGMCAASTIRAFGL